jgi:hypothetical protein
MHKVQKLRNSESHEMLRTVTHPLLKNEMERIWDEIVVASPQLTSWLLPGSTEINHEVLTSK